MSTPTPYDTGEVLEPQLWPNTTGLPTEAWGNVDFDNDENTTIATVRMIKTSLGYELQAYQHTGDPNQIITFKTARGTND